MIWFVVGTVGGTQAVWACKRSLQERAQPGNSEEEVVGTIFWDELDWTRAMRRTETVRSEGRIPLDADMVLGPSAGLYKYMQGVKDCAGRKGEVANVKR